MGGLRTILLLAVCVVVVQLGREAVPFLAQRKQDGKQPSISTRTLEVTHSQQTLSTPALGKDNSLTQRLRVPEGESRASSAVAQILQPITTIFGWSSQPNQPQVIPRKLTIPAGSTRNYEQAAALQKAASADVSLGSADITLGAAVNQLTNPAALLSERTMVGERFPVSEKSRRFLAQGARCAGADCAKQRYATKLVSAPAVQDGQLSKIEVEVLDKSGQLLQDSHGVRLDWSRSVLVTGAGVGIGLGHGLAVSALRAGTVVVSFTPHEVGVYTLYLVLNSQPQPPIPITVFGHVALATTVKSTANGADSQSSEETTASQKASLRPRTWQEFRDRSSGFPGWPWLVGGVSGFAVFASVGIAVFAVHLRRKARERDGRGPTTHSQPAQPANENEGDSKAIPDSLQSSGEITGPQAFLWAVQETGGPGLEETGSEGTGLRETGQKPDGVKPNRSRGKGSPRLLSMAVKKLREKNLEAAKAAGEADVSKGDLADVSVSTSNGEPNHSNQEVVGNKLPGDNPVSEGVKEDDRAKANADAEVEADGAHTERPETVRNGATLSSTGGENEGESNSRESGGASGNGTEQLGATGKDRGQGSGPEAAKLPSTQGAPGSALWSPLTFSVPSVFTEAAPSKKRRAPKSDLPKPRTPRPKKSSIFAGRKAVGARRAKPVEREVWSKVGFVSPPVAKPGKVRRTDGEQSENSIGGPEARKALNFRPTPLHIPGATGPLKQSALWSPVKTFGVAQPVDALNVSENGGKTVAAPGVVLGEKKANVTVGVNEIATGVRKLQPSRFKPSSLSPPSRNEPLKGHENADASPKVVSGAATPLRESPVLWSPTFNDLMEAVERKGDKKGDPEKGVEKAPRGARRMDGRATLSSTSGAEIAALLQELERRTAGHTLSPFTAYEKLVAEDRKTRRSENPARFLSLGGDEMCYGEVVSMAELDTPKGEAVCYNVSVSDSDVTLSAFLEA